MIISNSCRNGVLLFERAILLVLDYEVPKTGTAFTTAESEFKACYRGGSFYGSQIFWSLLVVLDGRTRFRGVVDVCWRYMADHGSPCPAFHVC